MPNNLDMTNQFHSEKAFKDEVKKHLLNPEYLKEILQVFFDFTHEVLKLTDGVELFGKFDVERSYINNSVSNIFSSRIDTAETGTVNSVYKSTINELITKYHNRPVQLEGGINQRFRSLGCLYNGDSIGPKTKERFYYVIT